MKRILIQILLVIGIVVLSYLLYDTIQTPISFEKEKTAHYDEVVQQLKDIRTAQQAFKDVNEKFCSDWDSLIDFVKYDSLSQIKKIGMLTDEMIADGLTEKKALEKGLIIRDTIKVSVLDEVFGADYDIDNLKIIPNSGGQVFWLQETIIITGSGVSVPVFEARAHNNQVLFELEDEFKQQIVNLNEQSRKNERYPGLKVGSVDEPNNNAGNWE